MKEGKRFSQIARNVPSVSDNANAFKWLESRQKNDNAEGLWRVHDDLYDLNAFITKHPGGPDWIKLTKGTDLTEAFEVHHLNNEMVKKTLEKFHVRKAELPRNIAFTFKENGFYRTLRGRVAEKLKTLDQKRAELTSKVFIDTLLFVTILTAVFSVKFESKIWMVVSGVSMCYTVIAAHNFLHRRDNIRMFYYNLGLFNYREWRISHAMSHHLYPNSLFDIEVTIFEPILCWIPSDMKNFTQRYLSWIYSPIIYALLSFNLLMRRIVQSISSKRNLYDISDLFPFIVPLAMIMFSNSNLFTVLKIWLQIIIVNSFTFGVIGINAGHHHPDVVHEGDKIREDLDWGIYTIDTIMDNSHLRGG